MARPGHAGAGNAGRAAGSGHAGGAGGRRRPDQPASPPRPRRIRPGIRVVGVQTAALSRRMVNAMHRQRGTRRAPAPSPRALPSSSARRAVPGGDPPARRRAAAGGRRRHRAGHRDAAGDRENAGRRRGRRRAGGAAALSRTAIARDGKGGAWCCRAATSTRYAAGRRSSGRGMVRSGRLDRASSSARATCPVRWRASPRWWPRRAPTCDEDAPPARLHPAGGAERRDRDGAANARTRRTCRSCWPGCAPQASMPPCIDPP
jgi:hypothetical protein